MRQLRILVPTFVLVLTASCGGGDSSDGNHGPQSFSYSVPADIGDGWPTGDLAAEGIDTPTIVDMMDRILFGSFPGIDSIAIARNGKLLLYWYDTGRKLDEFDDWIGNRDRERHVLHSTSKSFTSALIGIAIDRGFIASTQVGFYGMFPYSSYANPDTRKDDMTLEDALTMRLGLRWDEWSWPYTDSRNDLATLTSRHSDWPKALLDLPMIHDPGTVFAYNTAATTTIGQALENATGQPMAQFANANLFYPMQINDAEWATTPTGLPVGGSGLFLRTRDLAKFGQLYVDGGVWQGQRLVSAAWVAESVVPRVDLSSIVGDATGYGYQWWLDELDYGTATVETWSTRGYGGQYVFCVPSLNLVVAFTGHNYDNSRGIEGLFTMMRLYILAAID